MINKENIESYYTLQDGKHRRLSRKFESELPQFSSHIEASEWFSDLFNKSFVLGSVFSVGEQKCWDYQLIHNRKEWEAGREMLITQGHSSDAMDYLWSYQNIQIFDDGNVHIVF
ncbi:hypothetical protein D3C72_1660850 [compost metagenome]